MKKNVDLSALGKSWGAPFVARNQVDRFSGGMVTSGSLAVFDSKGIGPEGRIMVNRKVVYPTDALIRWLEDRTQEAY